MMNNDKVKQFSIDSLLYDRKLIGDSDSNKRTTTGCLEENGRALSEKSDAEREIQTVNKKCCVPSLCPDTSTVLLPDCRDTSTIPLPRLFRYLDCLVTSANV
uniref:Uncharacterized protein n=1 Tax=Romanomermis culicivorax TaxID=13658 RepID=A0A915L6N5_ROMCU